MQKGLQTPAKKTIAFSCRKTLPSRSCHELNLLSKVSAGWIERTFFQFSLEWIDFLMTKPHFPNLFLIRHLGFWIFPLLISPFPLFLGLRQGFVCSPDWARTCGPPSRGAGIIAACHHTCFRALAFRSLSIFSLNVLLPQKSERFLFLPLSFFLFSFACVCVMLSCVYARSCVCVHVYVCSCRDLKLTLDVFLLFICLSSLYSVLH